MLGSNERLNAVVLGEENTVIDAQIERIRKNIETLQEEKERIKSTITQPDDNSENLWTDWNKKKINTEDLSKKLDKFYTTSAAELIVSYCSDRNAH